MLFTFGTITVVADRSGSIAVAASPYAVFDEKQVWHVAPSELPRQIIVREAMGLGRFMGLSPGGTYLAIGTSRGLKNGGMRLEVHTLASGRVARPLDANLLLDFNSCVWVGAERLACVAAHQPTADSVAARQRRTIEEWERHREGREPSVSVLRSGLAPARFGRAELYIINLASSASRTVATVEAYIRGTIQAAIVASPDERWVAIRTNIRRPLIEPVATLYGVAGGYKYNDVALTVASVEDLTPARPVTGAFFQNSGRTLYYRSSEVRWSPDGSRLAALGKAKPQDETVTIAYTVDPSTGAATPVSPARWQSADLAWTSGNGLLLYGCRDDPSFVLSANINDRTQLPPCASPAEGGEKARRDWWTVSGRKLGINLTKSFKTVPLELRPGVLSRDEVVGVSDGKLWRIPANGGTPTDLTAGQDLTITKIVWPPSVEASKTTTNLLLEGTKSGRWGWLEVSFHPTGVVRGAWIANPTEGGKFAAYSPEAGVVVKSDEDDGTFIWAAKSHEARNIMALNTHRAWVAWPQEIEVPYRGQDGNGLRATVMLPSGYQAGKKYPLVMWVYPGENLCSLHGSKHSTSFDNAQLLAARGYVVACPEMPVPPHGSVANWRAELPKGVFGAIDKLVEMGIADSDRVGIIGHSFGGFATLSLVTMSDRFKAAVAMAPISNFLSDYGTFPASERYFEGAHEFMRAPVISEFRQNNMGGPPWKDLQQYVMNSPVSYVNRVNTPVMLVHGDMDNLPIQQSEEFFTGLYRQGKRAEFVRYWGEGHAIQSPANVRDLWQRIYAWFEEFLSEGKADRVTSGRR